MSSTSTAAAAVELLLKKAPELLGQIERSYIVTHRGHTFRPMPQFAPQELSLGQYLGSGGFSIVHEISNICLTKPKSNNDNSTTSKETDATTCTDGTPTDPAETSQEHVVNGSAADNSTVDELDKARLLMEKRAQRDGKGRYAIKRLHGNLNDLERARGRLDLAVEARYLSVVEHPNIVKLRGVASGSSMDIGFFLIMDRLFGTLDEKINRWFKQHKQCSGGILGLGKKRNELRQLLVDRLTVAYDLAAAFFYLHENRIVYRDIKPENVGFDIRGDAKIFDFGLCKSLSSELRAHHGSYGYRLTGRAGSLPYMAPEVIRMETYDTKCDVYSFSILLWEMLCLKQAFKGLTPTEFVERVVLKKERLPIPKASSDIPPLIRLLLPEAWDDNPRTRPDMKRFAILLRADLMDLTTDENVLNRTNHMEDRSVESLDATN